jgi:hypothetical protein
MVRPSRPPSTLQPIVDEIRKSQCAARVAAAAYAETAVKTKKAIADTRELLVRVDKQLARR